MKKLYFIIFLLLNLLFIYNFNFNAQYPPYIQTEPKFNSKVERENETNSYFGNVELTRHFDYFMQNNRYYRIDFPYDWKVAHFCFEIDDEKYLLERMLGYEVRLDNSQKRIKYRDFASIQYLKNSIYLVLTISTDILYQQRSPFDMRDIVKIEKNELTERLLTQYNEMYSMLLKNNFYYEYNNLVYKINELVNIDLKKVEVGRKDFNLNKIEINENNKKLDKFLSMKDDTFFLNRYNFIINEIKNLVNLYNQTTQNLNNKFNLNFNSLDTEVVIEKLERKEENFKNQLEENNLYIKNLKTKEEEKNEVEVEKEKEIKKLKDKIKEINEYINNEKIGKEKVDLIINSYQKLLDDLGDIFELEFFKIEKDYDIKNIIDIITELNGNNLLKINNLTKYKKIENNYKKIINLNKEEILKNEKNIEEYNKLILKLNNLLKILENNKIINLNLLLEKNELDNNVYEQNLEKLKENEENIIELFKNNSIKLKNSINKENNIKKENLNNINNDNHIKTENINYENKNSNKLTIIEIISLCLCSFSILAFIIVILINIIKTRINNKKI